MVVWMIVTILWICFNPCFVGEGIQTGSALQAIERIKAVSILVLLEKGFRQGRRIEGLPEVAEVSILVLLEKGFRQLAKVFCEKK